MKNTLKVFFFLVFAFFLSPLKSFAYTINDVKEHDTPSDCWVVFENNVFDLSKYIPAHDRFLDIREWCGKDMTEDFKDKAGVGRDHTSSSYRLLEGYNIGKLEVEGQVKDVEKDIVKANGYNLVLPLFFTLLVYWAPYFLIKKKVIKTSIIKFNAFWNTVLMLTLLIPSFGFGIFMMIRTKNPALYNINFDFIYWHVELSVVMGTIAISHFLQRWGIFKSQVSPKINK